MLLKNRDSVVKAIKKDISRRYIAISKLQSDGRLELDRACLNILTPSDGEEFFVIDDVSSILIVRNPKESDKSKIICSAKYEEKRKRLRLNQLASRILLCVKVGIRVFKYSEDQIALEAEPFIDEPDDLIPLNLTSIDELAPYILRSSRSVLHIDVLDRHQKINNSGTTFRILGEYWISKWHQDITDKEFKFVRCSNQNCSRCEDNLTFTTKQLISFPVIAYESNHYPRPGLISFHSSTTNTSTTSVYVDLKVACKEWAKKCGTVEPYFKKGIIDYTGDTLYKIETNYVGDVEISEVKDSEYKNISIEENGLMRLALKELIDTVNNYKP